MKRKNVVGIMICMLLLSACAKSEVTEEVPESEPETVEVEEATASADDLYQRLLDGDRSVLSETATEKEYIPVFTDGDYEYTKLNLDDDGESELMIRKAQEPETYMAVFNAEDGQVDCWFSDSVEMICYDYPLDSGLMVSEYSYNDSISYHLYRYHPDGQVEDIKYLYIREPAEGETEYRIDNEPATQEAFEQEMQMYIEGHRLDETVWVKM